MVIRVGPGSANHSMIPESTHGSAINATFTVEPTTIQPNSSNADETPEGIITRRNVIFSVGGPNAGTLSLSAIAVSSANEIFLADRYNHRIHIHNMEGAYLGNFPTLVPGYAVYVRSMIPQDMSIDGKDNLWVVGHISQLCSAVVQYSKEGQGLSIFQKCGERYGGIAVDLRNNHIVLKQVNKLEVHIYRPDGSLVRKIGGKQFAYSNAVVVNNIHGSILMLKENTVRVVLYNQYGQDFYSFGSRGSGEGELMVPTDICTDSSGQVIVAERRNRRVSVFTSRGEFVRHVRTGQKMVKLVAVGPKGQLVVTYHFDDTVTIFSTY
ncbi:PREDICTED: tripartite motif-containing protein 2-like [Branchiostoma belcheri]|uniref:Tripartite motif-containing protein 2-like n=1 Tax=Branchiostoma belcheri TaxID=7741 RepID=A0A6P4YUL0_BRABE|nr:PREDICTED: tripartite motif-containing protein 2-like [Branchiostoma belcheri]